MFIKNETIDKEAIDKILDKVPNCGKNSLALISD